MKFVRSKTIDLPSGDQLGDQSRMSCFGNVSFRAWRPSASIRPIETEQPGQGGEPDW